MFRRFRPYEPDAQMPIPANIIPLRAIAVEGEVVLLSAGPGAPVSATFTPEAVLASLDAMRSAAECAIEQRGDLRAASDDHDRASP